MQRGNSVVSQARAEVSARFALVPRSAPRAGRCLRRSPTSCFAHILVSHPVSPNRLERRVANVCARVLAQITPGFAKIPMGEKCQSRFKYVPEIPEATRTAQLWHLRYQDVFLQPSAVTVLRDRASDFAPRRRKSPNRRVQVNDEGADSPRAPVEPALVNSMRRPAGDQFPRPPQQHPDIRPGEALVCKSEGKQVSYWALSKVVSGAEQWRQLADLPAMPPPGGRGRKSGRNPQGILSPAPRKGVQFEDKSPRMGAKFEDTVQRGAGGGNSPVQAPWWTDEKGGAASPENNMEDSASPTATYLPQIHRAIQQRRMERVRSETCLLLRI